MITKVHEECWPRTGAANERGKRVPLFDGCIYLRDCRPDLVRTSGRASDLLQFAIYAALSLDLESCSSFSR